MLCTRCQHPIARTDTPSEMTAYADLMLWPLGTVRALARKDDRYIVLIECPHCGRENDVALKF